MLTRMNTRFSKIGNRGGKWVIEFEHLGMPNKSVLTYANNQTPRPELRLALEDTDMIFKRLLRLHEMVTTSVDFVHFKFIDDVMHVEIVGEALVDGLTITLKTSKIPEVSTEKIPAHLHEDEIEAVELLQDEAIEYLNGNRAQLALGFEREENEQGQ